MERPTLHRTLLSPVVCNNVTLHHPAGASPVHTLHVSGFIPHLHLPLHACWTLFFICSRTQSLLGSSSPFYRRPLYEKRRRTLRRFSDWRKQKKTRTSYREKKAGTALHSSLPCCLKTHDTRRATKKKKTTADARAFPGL